MGITDVLALFAAAGVAVVAAWFAAELFYWLIGGDKGDE